MSVLHRLDISMRSFYVFNTKFSTQENDADKKVLYYHPEDIELNTKLRDVGLSEAIVDFTNTFTDDSGCKALHTQKTTQLFYQAEPGYWLVLVINVPKEVSLKDGIEVPEYRGIEVQDRIFHCMLEQCYNTFRLFNGTFQMIYDEHQQANDGDKAREYLQQRLKLFFDKHLNSLKLSTCDVWDLTRSIQYLPLDKFLFLRAHNFVNMIRASFPSIIEMIFLYKDQVVCSEKLNATDLYSLHEYLVDTLLPKSTPTQTNSDHNLDGVFLTRTKKVFSANKNVDEETDETEAISPPRLYLQMGVTGKLQTYDLIVYRSLNATMCLFVNDHKSLPDDFYTDLNSYINPQLSSIAREIDESATKTQQQSASKQQTPTTSTTDDDDATNAPKYLFINEQSLKHLSNISMERRRAKLPHSSGIPHKVMNLIADLYVADNEQTTSEEVQVKTTNDFWIVKRRCNWRQYYVIIFNNKANLLEVTYEAKRIFEQELTDDVFFDK